MKTYPKNKGKFLKLIEFAKTITKLLESKGIKLIVYGSLAFFIYTRDKNSYVNDIDFLTPKNSSKKIVEILRENNIDYKYFPKYRMIQVFHNGLKIELDEILSFHQTLPIKINSIVINGLKLKLVSFDNLVRIYLRASQLSKDNPFGNKKKYDSLIAWKEKKYRPAVFVVVYKKQYGKIFYLLLKRRKHWIGWEFTKGGIEQGEDIIKAVKREIFEESGLKPKKIIKFRIKGKYKYHKLFKDRPGFMGQKYQLFSGLVDDKPGKTKVKLDKKEHSDWKWLEFNSAIKLLTHKNQKRCLSIVNNYLLKLYNIKKH